jgi:hypothetical protein
VQGKWEGIASRLGPVGFAGPPWYVCDKAVLDIFENWNANGYTLKFLKKAI